MEIKANSGTSALARKALCVRLTIRQWTARREDSRASVAAAGAFSASPKAGKFIKNLVPDEAIESIRQIATRARTFHYSNTLPWLDGGTRLVPAVRFRHYYETMDGLRRAFEDEARVVIDKIEEHKRRAQSILGGMFREEDYPSSAELANLYEFSVRAFPVPTEGDIRVDIGNELAEAIAEEIRADMERAEIMVREELASKLFSSLASVSRGLKVGGDGACRITSVVVETLRNVAASMRDMNIIDDHRLNEIADEALRTVLQHSAADMRDFSSVRTRAAEHVDRIMDKMRSSGLI